MFKFDKGRLYFEENKPSKLHGLAKYLVNTWARVLERERTKY